MPGGHYHVMISTVRVKGLDSRVGPACQDCATEPVR